MPFVVISDARLTDCHATRTPLMPPFAFDFRLMMLSQGHASLPFPRKMPYALPIFRPPAPYRSRCSRLIAALGERRYAVTVR